MRQFLILFAICSVFVISSAQEPLWMKIQYYLQSLSFHNIPSAPNVTLSQYAGLWFDIAHIPFYWQQDCFCSTAEYTLKNDGGLTVNNSCIKDSVNGTESFNIGEVYQAGNETSQLCVGFFNAVAGPYWILNVADDYSYSMVGSPALDKLWILSRKPTMNNSTFTKLVDQAESYGFPTNTLVFSVQAGCPTFPQSELWH